VPKKTECDKCGKDYAIYATLTPSGKYIPGTAQYRCKRCLDKDDSMKYINGKWVKYN
jgi:DNA-directed RNA polymerase subunit M/transcription elongation factor TFIIS